MCSLPSAWRPPVSSPSWSPTTSCGPSPQPDDPARAGAVGLAPTPAARAVGATKVYGSGDTAVVALDDVSVEIPIGRYTAIMGPSGSGKSTLMHCIAGLDSLTSGQVFVGDQDLGRLSEDQLTLLRRDRIGFVFQSSTWCRR
jgi:putative ABC transport system ATP-binding protein